VDNILFGCENKIDGWIELIITCDKYYHHKYYAEITQIGWCHGALVITVLRHVWCVIFLSFVVNKNRFS